MIKNPVLKQKNRCSMQIFGKNPGKMDTPTKMALVQRLNSLEMKTGWHHRVPEEKIYDPVSVMLPPQDVSEHSPICILSGMRKM
jgi:hypothetical protein